MKSHQRSSDLLIMRQDWLEVLAMYEALNTPDDTTVKVQIELLMDQLRELEEEYRASLLHEQMLAKRAERNAVSGGRQNATDH